jgi:hypothetical protein
MERGSAEVTAATDGVSWRLEKLWSNSAWCRIVERNRNAHSNSD